MRPTLPDPSSPIARHIVAFVRHKRSLNRRYDVEEEALRLFDRYLVEAGVGTLSEINTAVQRRQRKGCRRLCVLR